MSADELLLQACTQLGFDYDKITSELMTDRSSRHRTTVVKYIFSLLERPAEHSELAGAILMWELYREAPTDVRSYLKLFKEDLRSDVVEFMSQNQEYIDRSIKENAWRDFRLNVFSVLSLLGTYLSKDRETGEVAEIPQMCWMRIAVGEFCNREPQLVWKTYQDLIERKYIPASPTIFNMGWKSGAPSSCMIYSIADDLEDIYDVQKEIGLASKNNAGHGLDLSELRHSEIGRQGMSEGIMPLVKVLDDQTEYVNQGGRRKGALTISIRAHHFDLPEFIDSVDKLTEKGVKINRANTAVMLPDLFFKRCTEGGKWTLFCPKQTNLLNKLHGKQFEEAYVEYERKAHIWKMWEEYTKLKQLNAAAGLSGEHSARFYQLSREFDGQSQPERIYSREFVADELMSQICERQTATGMPYVTHGCNINRKNNMCNVGPVRSLNLCQEICIPAVPREQTGCCNLSSVSLPAFVKGPRDYDFVGLGAAVRHVVACLNQVIDNGNNLSDKAKKSNELNRPIGIGVSGFADACHSLDIPITDVSRLPTFVGKSKEGESLYRNRDYRDAFPSYDEASLKERTLNPELSRWNRKLWSCMYYNALLGSLNEAKLMGPYPNFATSPLAAGKLQYHLWQEEERETGRKYPFSLVPDEPSTWGQEGTWKDLIDEIKKWGVRNALLLTVMPTASTAQVLGNCEATEFHMQNVYTRKVLAGECPVLNYHLVRDLSAIDLWNERTYAQIIKDNGSVLGISEQGLTEERVHRLRFIKEKYLTMWEIPLRIMIQLSAERQPFIDHSQSFNWYLAKPTKQVLKAAHTLTWKWGLKTSMYYLRTRSANQAVQLGVNKPESELDALINKAKSEQDKSAFKAGQKKAEVILTDQVCRLDAEGNCIGCQ